jgi:hypothetical protein
MRFWWSANPLRSETPSRPRVARAVAEARMAQAGAVRGLGSAGVDTVMLRQMEAVERAAATGPLRKALRRARRGLSPELLWETARAAREVGRTPEEVWAEALRDWLASQRGEAPAPRPAGTGVRRQQIWREIEETMAALRAS